MRTEALQKCSNLAFKGALQISLVVLLAWGLEATLKRYGYSGWVDTVPIVAALAVLMGLFAQDFMDRSGFECAATGLVIHRPMGNSTILYPSITRVDRVRRVASDKNDHPTLHQDRPGWLALLLPLAAFGLAALAPIPLSSVGWNAAAMLSGTLGFIALPASVIFAIIVAVRSWRDRPSRRNRALGGMVIGLLLSAFCVLALIEVNRKSAEMQRRLNHATELQTP